MTIEEFGASERERWRGLLLAMWWDVQGDWEQAHTVAQEIESREGSWVHAYLHRREGDAGNAAYWYRRAGRPVATGPLEQEQGAIVRELLESAAA